MIEKFLYDIETVQLCSMFVCVAGQTQVWNADGLHEVEVFVSSSAL